MTPSKFNRLSLFKKQCLATVALVTGLSMGGAAQAQVVNFYASETADGSGAASLLHYSYNSTTTTTTLLGTYTPTGIIGDNTSTATSNFNEGALLLSGDGNSLVYAGFNASKVSTEVIFNLSAQTFDTSTAATNATIRASYTQSAGSALYTATGSISTATLPYGGTSTATTITTGTAYSVNSVAYNPASNILYTSRNSTGAGGIYSASGLPTSPSAFTALSGSGWSTANVYDGIGFLGANTLFVANTTTNALQAFTNGTPSSPSTWALSQTLGLTTSENIQQLSVDQIDANNALLLFTTDSGVVSGGTSTLEEVSFNSTTGFGTPTVLDSSTIATFSGVAAVPEPGTYATFGLGLGTLLCLMVIRRKKNQEI